MNRPTTIDHEKLFHSLSAPYMVVAADDPLFTIIEENDAHAKVAMVTREETIGKPLLEAFPDVSPQYLETGVSELVESIRRVIKTGKPDTMPLLQYDLKDAKGRMTKKYWRATHHPAHDDSGKVVAVYQATEDISEEVIAKEHLERTERQLRSALRSGSIGTWHWELGDDKVFADENLCRMFGLSSEKVQEGVSIKRFTSCIHPGDRKRVKQEIADAIESQTDYESEYRTLTSDGEIRWVIARGRVELDDKGNANNFPGVIVDISDRKNAESRLSFLTNASIQFSASLDYKKTLNNIASMVVPTVADWCTVELLQGDDVLEQVAVAHKDPKKVAWAKELSEQTHEPSDGAAYVLKSGKPLLYSDVTDEMLVEAAKDEEELDLLRSLGFSSVIIMPLKIDNKVIGIITLVSAESHVHFNESDLEIAQSLANRASLAVYNATLYQEAKHEIKERKQLQQQLEVLNDALETRVEQRTKQLEETNQNLARSNQELQDFAFVASHDLQEPLRKIQAFGDILEAEFSEQLGEGSEYLVRMRSAASRMSVLIEDLLSFSRVSTKTQNTQAVDLNTIATDVVADLSIQIERTDGEVTLDTLPTVQADPTHMRQLLQNLIGNALKFHREGTPPCVRVRFDPPAASDEFYTIRFEDNGIGFDEKYLDRIFSVFQRLHGRGTYEGTGIGLAVCRKIAERYGGTIRATSKKGEGSTFIFNIPIKGKETVDEHSK